MPETEYTYNIVNHWVRGVTWVKTHSADTDPDPDDTIPAAVLEAVRTAADEIGLASVNPALAAAARAYDNMYTLTVAQFLGVALSLIEYHESPDTPLRRWLADNTYGAVPLEWLNKEGRKRVREQARPADHLWIGKYGEGLWVFKNPVPQPAGQEAQS